MNKLFYIIIVILLAFISTNLEARNGIYVTGEAGIATLSNLPPEQAAGITPSRIRDTSNFPSAYRISLGYNHDFSRWFGFGLNIGAGRYGKETYYFPNGNTDISVRTLEFLGVGTFHICKTDLFFKAGGIRETPLITGLYKQENHTDSRPEYAVGAAYNFTPHIAATLTYAHVMGLAQKWPYLILPKNPDINQGLFGLRYTF